MKLPSLRWLNAENFKVTFFRFPLSILSGFFCSGLLMWTTWSEAPYADWTSLERMAASAFLGILLFTGLALLAERNRLRSWLIQLLGVPVLVGLVYIKNPEFYDTFFLSCALVFVGSLALIFAGPYLRSKEENGFWRFGIRTWNGAILSIATALIVVAALELALASIENLFELTLDYRFSEMIPQLFLVAIPNVVFLMNLPSNYKELEQKKSPFDFRAFGNFLFAPLLSLYFLILVSYVGKVLATAVWPSGFVAMPILIFSALGFGFFVLVYPLLQAKENRFLRAVATLFLSSELPFLAVYFVALWKRIDQYGVTELRYLGVALGVLLLVWTLGFWWKKAPLKLIPTTLFVASFLVSFGPWGAFSVSENSQLNRLEALLLDNGLLKDGAVMPSSDSNVNATTRQAISGTLDYLVSHYGEAPIAAWFGGEEKVHGVGSYGLMSQLGLSYISPYDFIPEDGGTDYYFNVNDTDPENVTSYQYQVHYYYYQGQPLNTLDPAVEAAQDSSLRDLTYTLGQKTVVLHYNEETSALEVSGAGKTLSIPFGDLMTALETDHRGESYVGKEVLSLSGENNSVAVKIYFNNFSYHRADGARSSLSVDADVLVRVK